MRLLAGLLVALLFALLPASAQDKPLRGVALVIGQSDYANLPALKNPASDAAAMEDLLRRLGFEVTAALDGDRASLASTIDAFEATAAAADVALVYYSGHGIEAGGQNYLVPVDADLSTPALAGQTLMAVAPVLDALAKAVPVTILLLDACRSDAFPAGTAIQLPGEAAAIEAQVVGLGELRGPAVVARPGVPDESLGMVIGFAAAPGQPALDGAPGEPNSPYAAALLKHLGAGGYSFGDVMTMVSEEVYLKTRARQLPWVNSSLRRILSFGAPLAEGDADEAAIRTGRRSLLLTMASVPQGNRSMIEAVAAQEQVPLDALFGMLEALGVDTSDPSQLQAQLEEGALRVRKLSEQPRLDVDLGADVDRLVALADTAETEGAFREALDFRMRAVDAASTAQTDAQTLQLAALSVKAGDASWTLFELQQAVDYYDKAAALADGLNADRHFEYLKLKADALAAIGEYKGDNAAYDEAITLYDAVMTYLDGQPDDDVWADAANDFGNALARYGERREELDYLEGARSAYEEVLDIWTREAMPIDWARVQNNLGNVLASLAERQGQELNLYYMARSAFRAALEEWTRQDRPLNWARAQNNLGTVLRVVGKVEENEASLDEAIAAFELALQEWTQLRSPYDWAMVNSNLGNALTDLGTMQDDRAKVEAGIAAYGRALEEWTRERVPLQWATVQNNIGATYATLGRGLDGEDSLAALRRAVEAYGLCLEERTQDRDPWNWALTNYNLGLVLTDIAGRVEGTGELEAAVAAYRLSLEVYGQDSAPTDWADVQDVMGWALAMLGYRTENAEMLQQARTHMEAAYDFYRGQDGARGYFEERLSQIDTWLATVS
ncbi:MAG: caspase family protein [Devosia sp.]|uniref:caspase family protein n=1 Tax=Devosia sp. TaxID=1871048 RepID=UPI001A36E9A9|nr:caspase family protein [Devosia sp.]MBL8599175.1 caspase family protein [Devosia sp.]